MPLKFPTVRYVQIDPQSHELSSYDGTRRDVVFESDEAAAAALLPGRAELDCVAIKDGLLPRGATSVSRAALGDIDRIMEETQDTSADQDPLAEARLRFSITLLVERSEPISLTEHEIARRANPEAANRYNRLVDELERARRQRETYRTGQQAAGL